MGTAHKLTEGVCLTEAEQDGATIYSYITRWGNIRDVYRFIGSIVFKQFYNHSLDTELLKVNAFNALYLGMLEYDGERAVGAYASYHVFKAIRKFIEANGLLRYGESFAQMHKPRTFLLRYMPKVIPERALDCSLEYLAQEHAHFFHVENDTSALWERARRVALSVPGKAARNWEMVKAVLTGRSYADVAREYGVCPSTVVRIKQRMCKSMAKTWNFEEARSLYEGSTVSSWA